ncbi:DUF7351 domain-containing protein [Halobaculum marinum]|uniref:Helix-turn-helix domain-containing protein n=1 Tax=Halobaculum marinum TaxID=3031996 RepID=A0ABD5X0Y6_9EURY|nr:hypothetical protein [Halobaculum sp. DT55]
MTEDVSPTRRTFELLADETRLGIITSLGDASGEGGYATLAFSELQEAVGAEDNGRFNYHLKQLLGEFVEEKERGYGLTLAGIRAYQAVVARGRGRDTSVEPFELPDSCDSCGKPRYGWYEDGRAFLGCRSCGDIEIRYPVDGDRIDPDSPETVLEALDRRMKRDYASMFNGICPYCTGRVDLSPVKEADHWEATDMRPAEALVHAACRDCAWFLYANLASLLRFRGVVSEFYRDHGIDVWRDRAWSTEVDWHVDAVQVEPFQIAGRFEIDGDVLAIELDEELNIADWDRRSDD